MFSPTIIVESVRMKWTIWPTFEYPMRWAEPRGTGPPVRCPASGAAPMGGRRELARSGPEHRDMVRLPPRPPPSGGTGSIRSCGPGRRHRRSRAASRSAGSVSRQRAANGADMGTQGSTANAGTASLRELADPEFFARWAAVRTRLSLTPKSSRGHEEAGREYDAVAAEYRRRLDGTA
jgi:hypothetical protein